MPELSFGSHMFQDLVESDIFYGAVFENEKRIVYQPKKLEEFDNRFLEICPEYPELEKMIRVCVFQGDNAKFYYDMENEKAILKI